MGTERPGGPGFTPNKEIDELRWLPVAAAIDMLSYPRDGDLIREAIGQPATTPFIILHGTPRPCAALTPRAGRRRAAADRRRCAAHAVRLVDVLDAFDIRKVYSSIRCGAWTPCVRSPPGARDRRT